MQYNVAYGCGKCLKVVFISGQQLKPHIKGCVGFPKDDTASSSDWEPAPCGAQDSLHCSSKCSKEMISDSTKESSSHKSHKESTDWDNTPKKDKCDRDQSKSKKSNKK